MSRARVAILISGDGSNMVALVEASRAADCPYEAMLVLSNNPQKLTVSANRFDPSRPDVTLPGGGVITDAMSRDLEQFARRNRVPVCLSWRRNDGFDNQHASFAGTLGFNTHPPVRMVF